MSQKATKTWCLGLLPVLLFISFVTYYYSYAILQSYNGYNKVLNSSRSLCDGWITQKKWESLNFNITRKPRLFLSLEDFFWQEYQSRQTLPYGIKGSEPLLLKILAATPAFQLPYDNLQCRTCVVIGNGFSIKNKSLGKIIDKHDIVIRLNDAPVMGHEDDVGSKTTMRFFYPESASSNPGKHNEPGTLMVMVPFKQQDLWWLKEIVYDEKRVRKGFWRPPPEVWLWDVSKIRVLDPHFLHQTADKLLKIPLHPKSKKIPVHPTTGILAVFVALNYCDVVHIAGFGYPTSISRQPIHYFGYDTMKSMKNSYHDVHLEAEVLKRLEDSGAIVFLHPYL